MRSLSDAENRGGRLKPRRGHAVQTAPERWRDETHLRGLA
jgi:hypothetical protein